MGWTLRISANGWKCEYPDCGHVWLAQGEEPPEQCAKCRRRGWHGQTRTDGVKVAAAVRAPRAQAGTSATGHADFPQDWAAQVDAFNRGKSPSMPGKEIRIDRPQVGSQEQEVLPPESGTDVWGAPLTAEDVNAPGFGQPDICGKRRWDDIRGRMMQCTRQLPHNERYCGDWKEVDE